MAIKLGTTDITDFKVGSTDVNKIYLGSTEVWSKTPTPPATVKALKFTSTGAQTIAANMATLGSITPNFEYSTDDGTTWTTWTSVITPISFGNGTDLYIRGSNIILATNTDKVNFVFSTSSPVECTGNVMHLFDYTQDLLSFPDDGQGNTRGVAHLFEDCTVLATAPELPATTLPPGAYYSLFKGCTALTVSPNLPATTFNGSDVYHSMFEGCTSLTTPPALPALTLTTNAYIRMFWGCYSLNVIPALPATTLGSSCYGNMFRNCSQIKMSTRTTELYVNTYTFGANPTGYANNMFTGTGGELVSAPTAQTLYTANTIIS